MSMKPVALAWVCFVACTIAAAAFAKAAVPDDGTTTLNIGGHITYETKEVVERAVADALLHPAGGRMLVTLNSPGGLLDVANDIYQQLHSLRLFGIQVVTYVPGDMECNSACTVIFAAGQVRIAARSSRWLFHPPVDEIIRDDGSHVRARVISPETRAETERYIGAIDALSHPLAELIKGLINCNGCTTEQQQRPFSGATLARFAPNYIQSLQ